MFKMHYTCCVITAMPAPKSIVHAMIIFTLAASFASAQDASPAQEASAAQAASSAGREVCVFPVVDLSASNGPADAPAGGSGEGADRSRSMFSALSAELAGARFQLLTEDQWRKAPGNASLSPRDFLDPATAVRVAGSAGADLAVTSFYSVQQDRILVSVSFYDTRSGDFAAGFMRTWRYNLGVYSALHAEIRGALSRLDLLPVAHSGKPAPREVLLAALTFTGPQEGMEILLSDGRSAGKIDSGKLVFPAAGIKAGEPLLVEKRLAGYHTAWQRVRAAPVVSLSPLARSSLLSIEADWTFGQLIGAGGAVRLYFVPDFSFASFSLYPYGQAPASAWGNWLYHLDTEASLGTYLFFAPDSLVRFGASTGIGLIYSLLPRTDPSSYFDAYLNIISIWGELNLGRVSIFLRPEMKMALGMFSPNLLGTSVLMPGGVFAPVTLGAIYKW